MAFKKTVAPHVHLQYTQADNALTMPTDHAYKMKRLQFLLNQAVFSPSVRKIRNKSDSLAGVDMKQE